jgi:hypothetical protein
MKLAEPNGVLAQYKLCTGTVKCSQQTWFSQPKLEPKRANKRIDQCEPKKSGSRNGCGSTKIVIYVHIVLSQNQNQALAQLISTAL